MHTWRKVGCCLVAAVALSAFAAYGDTYYSKPVPVDGAGSQSPFFAPGQAGVWTNAAGDSLDYPVAGHDYVLQNGGRIAAGTFAGDTLTAVSGGAFSTRRGCTMTVTNLVVAGACRVGVCEQSGGYIGGRMTMREGAVLTIDGSIGNSGYLSAPVGVSADIVGTGSIRASANIAVLSGDLSGFHGSIAFAGTTAVGGELRLNGPRTWPADAETFVKDGISLTKGVKVVFNASMTNDTPNLGIDLSPGGGSSQFTELQVSVLKEVLLRSPLTQTNAGGGFLKSGDGALVLEGASPDFTGTLNVGEGTIGGGDPQAFGTAQLMMAGGTVLRFCSTNGPLVLSAAPLALGSFSLEMPARALPDEDHRVVDVLSMPVGEYVDLGKINLAHRESFAEAAYAVLETREEDGRLLLSVRYREFPDGYRRDPQTGAVQSRLRLAVDGGMGTFTVNGAAYETEAWTDTNATVTVRYAPGEGEASGVWMGLPEGAVTEPDDPFAFTVSAERAADVTLVVARADDYLDFATQVPFMRKDLPGRIAYVFMAPVGTTAFTVRQTMTIEAVLVVGGGRGEIVESIRPRLVQPGDALALSVGGTAADASTLVVGDETLTAAGGTTGEGIVSYLSGEFAAYGTGGCGAVVLSFSTGDTTARHGMEVDALTIQPLEAGRAEPDPAVTDAVTGRLLVRSEDYELAYLNSDLAERAYVAVTGLNGFAGLVRTLPYEIRVPFYSAGTDGIGYSSFVGNGGGWSTSAGLFVTTPQAGNVYVAKTSLRSGTATFAGDGLRLRSSVALRPRTTLTVPEVAIEGRCGFGSCENGCGTIAGRIVVLKDATMTMSEGYADIVFGLAADLCGRGAIVESTTIANARYTFSGNNRSFLGRFAGCHASNVQVRYDFSAADAWFGNPKTFDATSVCWTNVTAVFNESMDTAAPNRGLVLAANGAGCSSTLEVAANKRVVIDAPIASETGFVKQGAGTLVLAGTSPALHGTVSVTDGALEVSAPGALGEATLAMADGKRLVVETGGEPLVLASAPTGNFMLDMTAEELPKGNSIAVLSLPATAEFDVNSITLTHRVPFKHSETATVRSRVSGGRRVVYVRYSVPGCMLFVR